MTQGTIRSKKTGTHTVRTKDGGTKAIIGLTRGKTIKLWCTECMGFEGNPKTDCTSKLCPLFPFPGRTMATQHW